MPTDTTVKFFHSAMTGAPSLSGTNGALIAVLDALLVNGFGSGTVDSVVIAGGIATVTRSAGHSMEVGSVALIAGATVSGGSINGEQKVLSVTTTTYTFDATGISNQTATGTITHKVAPLGWTKAYSATNLAAYKSSDVTSTGCYLRIDDQGTGSATYARSLGYETMSDINTGIGAFPTSAQVSGGMYWAKSSAADATTRPWALVGDGKFFYLAVAFASNTSTSYSLSQAFGDFVSNKSPDAYGCVINGHATSALGTAGANASIELDHGDSSSAAGGLYFARSYTGLGSAQLGRKSFPPLYGATGVRSGAAGMTFPNLSDGGMYVAQHVVSEHTAAVYRGLSPGLYCSLQNIGASVFSRGDNVTGVTGLTGKTLKAVNSNTGVFFFDVTGPWR
jgi:hypothetical protein